MSARNHCAHAQTLEELNPALTGGHCYCSDLAQLALDDWRSACPLGGAILPGMFGLDLIDYLASSGTPPPAIFITALDDDNLRERASQFPNSVYLRKPFAGKGLLEAVCSLLKSNGSGEKSSET